MDPVADLEAAVKSNLNADKAAILKGEVEIIKKLFSTSYENIHVANKAADGKLGSAATQNQLTDLLDTERRRFVALRDASQLCRALAPHEAAAQEGLPCLPVITLLLPAAMLHELSSGPFERLMKAFRIQEEAREAEIAEYKGKVPPDEGGFSLLDENLAELKAAGVTLRRYYYWLVDRLKVIKRAEPPGPGTPPPQVQQVLPPLPATPKDAANTVSFCIDIAYKFGVIIILSVIFGKQMAASSTDTVLDLANVWNGFLTILTGSLKMKETDLKSKLPWSSSKCWYIRYLSNVVSVLLPLLSASVVAIYLQYYSVGSEYAAAYCTAINIASRGPYRVAELAGKFLQRYSWYERWCSKPRWLMPLILHVLMPLIFIVASMLVGFLMEHSFIFIVNHRVLGQGASQMDSLWKWVTEAFF